MEDPFLENMAVQKSQVFFQVLFAVSEEITEGLKTTKCHLSLGEGTNLQQRSMICDDGGGGEELTFTASHAWSTVLLSTFHE